MSLLTTDELWMVTLQLQRFNGRIDNGYRAQLPELPPGFPEPVVGEASTDWLLRVDAWARERAETSRA